MDFFKCEVRRKILVFGSGKLFFFFGLCVLAIFGQLCFTCPSLNSETNVSLYKKVSFAAADGTEFYRVCPVASTQHSRIPLGMSSEFSGLEEQTGNPSSLLFVLKITPFFLKMK